MPAPLFEIVDLHVARVADESTSATPILGGVSLAVHEGEVHALMGPNIAELSTLAAALLGSPGHEVTSGCIKFRGDDITAWGTDVRAKVGIFLAFSNPQEIAGVSMLHFLHQSLGARPGRAMSVVELRDSLLGWMERLEIDESFMERHVNEGFTNAEKQCNEILQMAILEPEMAILDETDAGLDPEGIRTLATGVRHVRAERPTLGTLAITHHQKLLDHLAPDIVHVLIGGTIVASGGPELVSQLATNGYESYR